jgi:predicted 3-demethylubiquinone-9 3-methyltransferase (glyoxalase superfamily)
MAGRTKGCKWHIATGSSGRVAVQRPRFGESQRAFEAMLRMKKLDIDKLKRAYEGK